MIFSRARSSLARENLKTHALFLSCSVKLFVRNTQIFNSIYEQKKNTGDYANLQVSLFVLIIGAPGPRVAHLVDILPLSYELCRAFFYSFVETAAGLEPTSKWVAATRVCPFHQAVAGNYPITFTQRSSSSKFHSTVYLPPVVTSKPNIKVSASSTIPILV